MKSDFEKRCERWVEHYHGPYLKRQEDEYGIGGYLLSLEKFTGKIHTSF